MSNVQTFHDADNVEQYYQFVKDDGGNQGALPPAVPSNYYPYMMERFMRNDMYYPRVEEALQNGGGWQLHAGGYVNTPQEPQVDAYYPPAAPTTYNCPQQEYPAQVPIMKYEENEETLKKFHEFLMKKRAELINRKPDERLQQIKEQVKSAVAHRSQYGHAQTSTAQRFDWAEDVENEERKERARASETESSENALRSCYRRSMSSSDGSCKGWTMDMKAWCMKYQIPRHQDEDEQENEPTSGMASRATTRDEINDSDDYKLRARGEETERERRIRQDRRNTGGYRMAQSAILDAIRSNKKSTTPTHDEKDESDPQKTPRLQPPLEEESWDDYSSKERATPSLESFVISAKITYDKSEDDYSIVDHPQRSTYVESTIFNKSHPCTEEKFLKNQEETYSQIVDNLCSKVSAITTEDKFLAEYSFIDESDLQRSAPYVDARNSQEKFLEEPQTSSVGASSKFLEGVPRPQFKKPPFMETLHFDETQPFLNEPYPQTGTQFVEDSSLKMPQVTTDEKSWDDHSSIDESVPQRSTTFIVLPYTEDKFLEEVAYPQFKKPPFMGAIHFDETQPCTLEKFLEEPYPQTGTQFVDDSSLKMSHVTTDEKSWDDNLSIDESDTQSSSTYVESKSLKKPQPYTEEKYLNEESYPQTRKPTETRFHQLPQTQSSSDGKYKTAYSTRRSSTSSDDSLDEDAVSLPFFTCELFLTRCCFSFFAETIVQEPSTIGR